jgi:hypothetical protein
MNATLWNRFSTIPIRKEGQSQGAGKPARGYCVTENLRNIPFANWRFVPIYIRHVIIHKVPLSNVRLAKAQCLLVDNQNHLNA